MQDVTVTWTGIVAVEIRRDENVVRFWIYHEGTAIGFKTGWMYNMRGKKESAMSPRIST